MPPMRFAISIPQFYADGEFDPAAFGAYFARVEELGFDSAWTRKWCWVQRRSSGRSRL